MNVTIKSKKKSRRKIVKKPQKVKKSYTFFLSDLLVTTFLTKEILKQKRTDGDGVLKGLTTRFKIEYRKINIKSFVSGFIKGHHRWR